MTDTHEDANRYGPDFSVKEQAMSDEKLRAAISSEIMHSLAASDNADVITYGDVILATNGAMRAIHQAGLKLVPKDAVVVPMNDLLEFCKAARDYRNINPYTGILREARHDRLEQAEKRIGELLAPHKKPLLDEQEKPNG